MTALIGGSVLLVAASTVALVFGWSTADESLIWTSIGASVGAGLLLIIAVVRSRKTEPAGAEPSSPRVESAGAESVRLRAASADRHPVGTTSSRAETPSDAAQTRPSPAADLESTVKPIAKPVVAPAGTASPAVAPAKRPAPSRARKTTEKPAAAATQNEVIAVPDRKRFHRASCRYASAKGAERMSKASARRRGYAACGVCKP